MKNLLIMLILVTIPFFTNAQGFNPSQIQLRNSPFPISNDRPPQLVQLPTMKPITSLSQVEKAQAKLAREEQKLIKLARKAWDQEDNLKKEQEQLKIFENTLESNNDSDHQKRIENVKKQIVKSQDKLNKAKTEVESMSKKVEDLEKAIEEAKFTRHD